MSRCQYARRCTCALPGSAIWFPLWLVNLTAHRIKEPRRELLGFTEGLVAFILNTMHNSTITADEVKASYARYYEYLDSIKDKLPASTYDFARADWHYDSNDPRSPHDAWVDTVTVRELSPEKKAQEREIEIHVRLLGAYHNGHIELLYKKVVSYQL